MGTAPRLTQQQLIDARATHELKNDCEPDPEVTPSSDQLAALKFVVDSGRVPFCDFGAWNGWGARLAKHQDTDATILVNGQFVTKRLAAPTPYASWRACWGLSSVGSSWPARPPRAICQRHRQAPYAVRGHVGPAPRH